MSGFACIQAGTVRSLTVGGHEPLTTEATSLLFSLLPEWRQNPPFRLFSLTLGRHRLSLEPLLPADAEPDGRYSPPHSRQSGARQCHGRLFHRLPRREAALCDLPFGYLAGARNRRPPARPQ